MKCGMKADRFVCKQPCNQQLTSCGHICPCSCGEECDETKCTEERIKICGYCYTRYKVKCNEYNLNTKCQNRACKNNLKVCTNTRRVYDRNYLLSLRSECIDRPNGIGPLNVTIKCTKCGFENASKRGSSGRCIWRAQRKF